MNEFNKKINKIKKIKRLEPAIFNKFLLRVEKKKNN